MNTLKSRIKKIIHNVVNEERDALKDVLDHEDTEDVLHASHHAWAGGQNGKEVDNNLVKPLDHAAAVGSDDVTRGIESLNPLTGEVESVSDRVISVTEAGLRESVRAVLRNFSK